MTADFASTQQVFDDTLGATVENARTSGGYIRYLQVSNPNTAQGFLQLFNAAAADVTLATTVPTQSYLIPAGDGVSRGSFELTVPIHFNTAISYAFTTTTTGAGGLTSNGALNMVLY